MKLNGWFIVSVVLAVTLFLTGRLEWIERHHPAPAPAQVDTLPVVAIAMYALPNGDTLIFELRQEEYNLLRHGGSVVRKGKK